MQSKIGKVYNYSSEKGLGFVITKEKTYMFISKDLETEEIKNGDVVTFSGELINNRYRAFFVRSYANKEIKRKDGKTK